MAGENVPVRLLQGGSTQEVAASGSIVVKSAGSVQVESGGVINVAAGGSFINAGGQAFSGSVVASGSLSVTGVVAAPAITLGGTFGRWAFGTVGLTSGVGTITTGLNRTIAAGANINGRPGLGSLLTVTHDLSLSDTGSVIFWAGTQAGSYTGNATISWWAFGT